MIRITAVCGMGLGSGLLVKMGVERVLKRAGFSEREFAVEVADISTARAMPTDIYVTTAEFSKQLGQVKAKVVEVHNLFSEKEIEAKLVEPYREVRAAKGLQ